MLKCMKERGSIAQIDNLGLLLSCRSERRPEEDSLPLKRITRLRTRLPTLNNLAPRYEEWILAGCSAPHVTPSDSLTTCGFKNQNILNFPSFPRISNFPSSPWV
jgi:hypothetical protein